MEIKRRVKMHKVKKHWVAIATMVVMLTGLGAVRVSADQAIAPAGNSIASSQTSDIGPAEATETSPITDGKTVETATTPEAKSQMQGVTEIADSEGTQSASAKGEQQELTNDTGTVAVSDSISPEVSDANSETDVTKHREDQNSSGSVSETHTFNQNTRMDTEQTAIATPAAGWYKGDTGKFYSDGNGQNLIGFQTIDGLLYYFQDNGQLVENQFFTPDHGSTWYCADETGQLLTGLKTFQGNTYFFRPDGSQVKGAYAEVDGNWYYLDKDNGQPLKSWQTIDGTKRYFDDNGVQAKNIDKTIDGLLYHFDDNGNPSGNQNEEHPSITGHFERSDNGYGHVFIDDKTGQKVSGVQYINGEEYHFSRLYYNNFLVKIGKD
ncbi:KxYKxGKxW signal peptide domain-containing protein, partial [Streptococcus tangpeifui]